MSAVSRKIQFGIRHSTFGIRHSPFFLYVRGLRFCRKFANFYPHFPLIEYQSNIRLILGLLGSIHPHVMPILCMIRILTGAIRALSGVIIPAITTLSFDLIYNPVHRDNCVSMLNSDRLSFSPCSTIFLNRSDVGRQSHLRSRRC